MFLLQNWHRAATYIPEMLSRTKLFEYWICLSSEPWLDPPHTVEVADKLAESLVDLRYSTLENILPKLEYLGKLKNLRNLDLKFSIARLKIEFIADIVKNFRKLEYLFLSIASTHAYDQNAYEPLFDLPYLRRLVIIVEDSKFPREKRDRLVERAAHLEFFLIEIC